jgi:hypothetical protein
VFLIVEKRGAGMTMQRPSMLKRQKERARLERRQEKDEAKATRKDQKKARAEEAARTGEDPDLVGLVMGPQRPLEE